MNSSEKRRKLTIERVTDNPDPPDPEDLLLKMHREKIKRQFNGIVRLEYYEGHLRKIKEEVTTHNLSKTKN